MSVRIRLSRAGAKKRPYYHVVVADQRAARDGKYIERIGRYNPLLPKENQERVIIDLEKAKAWLAKGAQPSEKVEKFLHAAGVVELSADYAAKPKKTVKHSDKQNRAAKRAEAEEEAKKTAEEEAKAATEAPAEETQAEEAVAAPAEEAPAKEADAHADEAKAEEAPKEEAKAEEEPKAE